ncbi:MAG TPA: M48 family metalloprotease [Planctomycetota bacterium]|jgi:predicted Zn-dependent protease|nr:M48 family metalloprotease [Planctomycetota bacterium]
MKSSLAVSLLLVLAGCATDRQVIQQAESTHSELEAAIIKDPAISGYLQSVGERIVAAAREADARHDGPKKHFEKSEDNAWMFEHGEFHLVNSKTLNAFTTGGSHMYIYSQLMQTCRTEDELAAVMAHEYAHVYSRHVQKGIDRQYYSLGASAGAALVGLAIGGKEHGEEYAKTALVSSTVVTQFLGLGYTREDEAEADKYGFDFYVHAGWDPQRFGDFFQQLIDQGLDKTPEIESDHPSLASRVEAAKARAAALPPEAASWRKAPVADASKFASLKTRVAQIGATRKTSEELAKAQTLLSAVPSCVTPVDQPDQKRAQATLVRALQAGPKTK